MTLHAVPAGAHCLAFFRIAGAVAFLAHAGALVTAGNFGWLWPR